jgi:hypothetical protein
MNDIFCCSTFAAKVSDAGSRGLSFLVGELVGTPSFVIQSRGVTFDDEERMLAVSVSLNVASEIPIAFCPFCGARLAVLLRDHKQEIEKLASSHHPLLGMFRAESSNDPTKL